VAGSRLQLEHPFPGKTVPKYRYIWVPAAQNNSMTTNLVGAGAGDPAMGELTTSSIAGVQIAAATDDHAFLMWFPADVDVEAPIDVRVIWSSNQTTVADSYTWTLLYTEHTLNSTSDLDAAGATALDTTIAADLNLVTADAPQATAWGTIDGSSLTGNGPDGYVHTFLLDPAAVGGTIASDTVVIWAFEFRYMPKLV
jgi:hypothetical protein